MAALKALVALGLYAALSSELLGAAGAYGFAGLLAAWLLGVAAVAAAAWKLDWRAPEVSWPEGRVERAALAACACVAAACLAAAMIAPANNYDSMTYHLPRVMHWLANRSLRQFPTQDLRQICFCDGASYLVGALVGLTGGDRFASLPQWAAFVALMGAVALCAKRLTGGSNVAAALGAALVAGMPQAALEASMAQDDLVGALWAACALAFALEDEPFSWPAAAWLCAALGLAAATKATAYMFAGPVLLVALARSRKPAARKLALAAGVAALSQLPALPYYLRNLASFGTPFGAFDAPLNARHGLGVLLSCGLRDLALQIPLPGFWRVVVGAHRALGLDPNDLATSMGPFVRLRWDLLLNRLLTPDCDFAASPAQLPLIVAAFVALWRKPRRDRLALAGACLFGALAFAWLLRWQEWGNRLMLPGFMLALPLAACWVAERWKEAAQLALVAALALSGVGAVALDVHHPARAIALSGREDMYFFSGYAAEHAEAVRAVSRQLAQARCDRVGLDMGDAQWEYLWWRFNPGAVFKRVNVENASRALPQEFPDERLCAVILAKDRAVVYFDKNDLSRMTLTQIHDTAIPAGSR